MSYTTIYKMGSEISELGDIGNAQKSAMYVWNQIAKKYFNQDYFPMFDKALISKIWNAHDHATLTDEEIIVLSSTMDKATVNAEGLPRLIEAFEAYGKQHDVSSYLEQTDLLRNADLKDGEYIGWCQTSCGEFWGKLDINTETEEYDYYNPNDGDIHFDVIEMFNKIVTPTYRDLDNRCKE